MKLNVNQIAILERINDKLVRGDIKQIVNETGLSRMCVSTSLSVNRQSFNKDVVQAAITIIAEREQVTKKSLALLNAN